MPAPNPAIGAAEDAATVSLDELDVSRVERFRANTHWPYFARLRRDAPVHRCRASAYGAYWSITRHADILAVEASPRQFSSDRDVIIGDVPPEFDATRAFATSDPPVHTRERRAVATSMSPRRVASLEERARAHICALLDGLPRGEAFDWVSRVSIELTTQMVAMLFDFPWAERSRLPRWCEALVTTPQPGAAVASREERDAIVEQYRAALLEMWRERATAPPGEDVISALAHHPDTASMTDDPWHLVGTVTLVAGANEASRGALSGAVVAFHQFPAEWEKLRANLSLASNATAEIIRWQSPISHMRRTATEDVEFRGQLIRRGERVVMWYCSANRDESCFPDGDVVRIDRPNARRHLAFGAGIHRCLGNHVADMQLRVLLEEMLARFERVEVVAEPRRTASNFSAGYDELLVRIPW